MRFYSYFENHLSTIVYGFCIDGMNSDCFNIQMYNTVYGVDCWFELLMFKLFAVISHGATFKEIETDWEWLTKYLIETLGKIMMMIMM